jgi:Fe-S oxidoreductase
VLEDAGFRVLVPSAPLCCGRPLYDYGFLDQADELLGDILTHLKPAIEAGTPVVGLEPSCLAVFRDEMLDLRPHDEDAKRLHGQAFTLAEFLTRQDYQPPSLHQNIVVHGHCHQKAIISLDAEKKLFEAMGAKAEILDDGCCGMAGSFGFEEHKYDVSMKVYEHQLGPHLRSMPSERLILADGFSCKTQIEQATGRRPLHLAQLLQKAKHGDGTFDHRNDGFEYDESDNSALINTGVRVLGGVALGLGAFYIGRRMFR